MKVMRGLRKKEREEPVAVTPVAPPKVRAPEAPPLIILLPDAQGIAAYHMHSFSTVAAAEGFVEQTLRGEPCFDSAVFWALTIEPASGHHAEPLVLIRDAERPVVYLFSFSNIDASFDFVRHELTRGLDLRQVMVYWAYPATVQLDHTGCASVIPSAPPKPARRSRSQADLKPAADAVSRVLPFPSAAKPNLKRRLLNGEDIADTIREMQDFAGKFTTNGTRVIDFPAATRHSRRIIKAQAALAWNNFAEAIDGALDVHVAQRVRIQIGINRVMRALMQAALAHQDWSHSAKSRWLPHEEPFQGFQSPPGRF